MYKEIVLSLVNMSGQACPAFRNQHGVFLFWGFELILHVEDKASEPALLVQVMRHFAVSLRPTGASMQ